MHVVHVVSQVQWSVSSLVELSDVICWTSVGWFFIFSKNLVWMILSSVNMTGFGNNEPRHYRVPASVQWKVLSLFDLQESPPVHFLSVLESGLVRFYFSRLVCFRFFYSFYKYSTVHQNNKYEPWPDLRNMHLWEKCFQLKWKGFEPVMQ